MLPWHKSIFGGSPVKVKWRVEQQAQTASSQTECRSTGRGSATRSISEPPPPEPSGAGLRGHRFLQSYRPLAPASRRSMRTADPGLQIIVVDNGSRDGSASLDSEFPAAQFLRLPQNFGLTKALNIGIRASDGRTCCSCTRMSRSSRRRSNCCAPNWSSIRYRGRVSSTAG